MAIAVAATTISAGAAACGPTTDRPPAGPPAGPPIQPPVELPGPSAQQPDTRSGRRADGRTTAAAKARPGAEPYGRPGVPPGARPPAAPNPGPGMAARLRRPARFTVTATGDFLLHRRLIEQAGSDARRSGRRGHDFGPMLARLRPVISGSDLGICHIETPVGAAGGPYSGYPDFNSPPEIVRTVRDLGYDTCSTASNHALDQGTAGVRRTLDALDSAKLAHAGTARTAEEAGRTTMLNVKGIPVAHLSFTYGTNGVPKPRGRPWTVNSPLSADQIIGAARRAKAAGAEVVIVSLHWGQEYQHAPTPEQTALARRLLSRPEIDLLVGHHAHVVQPMARVGGKWVAYGVGNQVANPSANAAATHAGIVARFTFTRDPAGAWRVAPAFVPTRVVPGPPIRLLVLDPAATGARGRGAGATTCAYQDTVDATTRVVRSLGEPVPLAGQAQAQAPVPGGDPNAAAGGGRPGADANTGANADPNTGADARRDTRRGTRAGTSAGSGSGGCRRG